MSYVLIQNQGELPEWGIRLLGLSTKDETQIGRFGTGLKEAIALLVRNELFPVIYSGDVRYDFCVMGSPKEIHYRADLAEWKGLNVHPDFGHHDWNDFWMVFREIICNAIDEEGLYHDITSDDPSGVAGSTRFYIPVNQEIIKAYGKVHERLLMLDEPIVAEKLGAVVAYEKRSERKAQIYHKGVWVQEDENDSLWDWELGDLKLNEARSADWYDVQSQIRGPLAKLSAPMATKMLEADCEALNRVFEFDCIGYSSWDANATASVGWKQAFEGKYGLDAVLCRTKIEIERVIKAGKDAVTFHSEAMVSVLVKAGVNTPSNSMSFSQQNFTEIIQPTAESQKIFDGIWDKIGIGDIKPRLQVFIDPTGPLGQYSNAVCYVNQNVIGSREERLTMIEEITHHTSKAADFSREFQTALVDTIDRVIESDQSINA